MIRIEVYYYEEIRREKKMTHDDREERKVKEENEVDKLLVKTEQHGNSMYVHKCIHILSNVYYLIKTFTDKTNKQINK